MSLSCYLLFDIMNQVSGINVCHISLKEKWTMDWKLINQRNLEETIFFKLCLMLSTKVKLINVLFLCKALDKV